MARKSRRTRRLRVVNPDCAGIDIGKDRHFVAVDPERTDEPVRSFGAFTRDLEAMAAWLASCGVTKVAMKSTSVYWIAVYETLERAGFEVILVPPRMTKQIGGRKSDVLDCQWIWQLMSYGLLRGEFRPGDEVCPLRSYARQMRRLTGDRSRCVLHMQKALTEMNVRLDSVIPNITGLTGQRILRAIIRRRQEAIAPRSNEPLDARHQAASAGRRRRFGGRRAALSVQRPAAAGPVRGRGRGIDFVDPRDLRPLAALDDLASDGRALGKREPAGARHRRRMAKDVARAVHGCEEAEAPDRVAPFHGRDHRCVGDRAWGHLPHSNRPAFHEQQDPARSRVRGALLGYRRRLPQGTMIAPDDAERQEPSASNRMPAAHLRRSSRPSPLPLPVIRRPAHSQYRPGGETAFAHRRRKPQ